MASSLTAPDVADFFEQDVIIHNKRILYILEKSIERTKLVVSVRML